RILKSSCGKASRSGCWPRAGLHRIIIIRIINDVVIEWNNCHFKSGIETPAGILFVNVIGTDLYLRFPDQFII
ncbi:MAG: hypothetical protein KAQ62_26610, partial [Cyclobacteriaceae bacterium]|nr:hypothetical protein [Cyclobacteriaceae bacterium]